MTYHNIITDPDALREFVEWLPKTTMNERYLVHLQARKKYAPDLGLNNLSHIESFVCDKRSMENRIRRLEVQVGCYQTRAGDTIPDRALALYITPNPRDMRKASIACAKSFVDSVTNSGKERFRPHAEVLSLIHKSKSRSVFVHFDIDREGDADVGNTAKDSTPIEEVKTIVEGIVGAEALTVVETRGGMHLLIEPSLVQSDRKDWHKVITKSFNVDQRGDIMLPVVGCNQGGYTPTFFR